MDIKLGGKIVGLNSISSRKITANIFFLAVKKIRKKRYCGKKVKKNGNSGKKSLSKYEEASFSQDWILAIKKKVKHSKQV